MHLVSCMATLAARRTTILAWGLRSRIFAEDSRHQLRLRASYLTHGVNIGVTFYYGTGTPLPQVFQFRRRPITRLRAPVGLALVAIATTQRSFPSCAILIASWPTLGCLGIYSR